MSNFFTLDSLLWLVRMLMVAAGSGITASGWMSGEQWQTVSAAILTLVGVFWSRKARTDALNFNKE